MPSDTEIERLRRLYDDVSFQVNREDSLVNYRLTWTLTLNGFLFASLALLAKDLGGQIKDFFESAIPLTGFFVSLAGVFGVHAAHKQLDWLKSQWEDEKCVLWPRPYGDKHAFFLGRLPSYVPMGVLTIVWGVFFLSQCRPTVERETWLATPASVASVSGNSTIWLHNGNGKLVACHSQAAASSPQVVCTPSTTEIK